ncbi:hypothetical protein NQ317_018536 [Molorchus minor]|uniref:Uncharacterized protein n=1 Tax=Molorchus minor TaxID=1323400 RepID=A0ABQ9JWU5_9CUCU|nr:hypothetical protein NQ317_018536 [Molorchus minor]
MKLSIIIVYPGGGFGSASAAPRVFLPGDLKVSNVEVDIPENDFENGNFTVNEVSLSGLGDMKYTVTDGDLETHVDYQIVFEEIAIIIDLQLQLSGILEANDNVYISVKIQNLKADGYGEVESDLSEMKDYYLLLTLGGTEVSVEGVVSEEYSQQLTEELSEKVPAIINQINKAIDTPASDIIKYLILSS